MAVAEKIRNAVAPPGVKPPKEVQERIERGRKRLEELAPKRNECVEFWRGNQYVHVVNENVLVAQPTAVSTNLRQGKPPHRKRLTRNLIADVVAQERSSATQRVPSYEINPTTTDPEDISAAKVAEKVALFGYDRWGVRQVTADVVQHAVVEEEGFAWPYWDTSKGRIVDAAQGICEGEVAIRVFSGRQVGWEPGCRFEESSWHFVQYVSPLDTLKGAPGFVDGELKADANTDPVAGKGKKGSKQVMVTEYLERPTPQNRKGRRLKIANGRLIAAEEAYPCWEYGTDELALHKLAYWTDPDSDRDMGLVRHLLDAQRTFNMAVNKISEWVDLALNPQCFVIGNVPDDFQLTDEPGKAYQLWGSNARVDWRPVPPVPQELFQVKNEARADMGRLAAQNDIPNQVDTAQGLQILLERDDRRRAEFVSNLADFHSKLMRHCILLVQKHYTEDRLLQIRGRFGWEFIKDFRGAQIRNQIDVKVAPGSIQPRTRAEIERRVMAFAQTFPGWLTPEAAWAAINGGTAEQLVEDYELDVSWANHCIQLLRGLADMSTLPEQIPRARPFDNHPVQVHVLQTWCKTQDFASQAPGVQEQTQLLIEQHQQLQAQDQAKAQAQQIQTAEQLGMANATKPSSAQMPSVPGGVSPPGGTPEGPAGPGGPSGPAGPGGP